MAATIDDLIRNIEQAKKLNDGMEQASTEDIERLEWVVSQYRTIGGLLSKAGTVAMDVKKRAPK